VLVVCSAARHSDVAGIFWHSYFAERILGQQITNSEITKL